MMKHFFLPVLVICLLAACNSSDKKHEGHNGGGKEPTTLLDSLLKDIDEGHMTGMSKIGKLHNTKKEVEQVIDSISKLPAAAQQAAATYVASLKTTVKEMEYADFAMEKWMMEYNEDSAKDNAEQHLLYLKDEQMKVGKMKEAILNSLHKADSLLKAGH